MTLPFRLRHRGASCPLKTSLFLSCLVVLESYPGKHESNSSLRENAARANKSMQRMRASPSRHSQFSRPRRLALTADAGS